MRREQHTRLRAACGRHASQGPRAPSPPPSLDDAKQACLRIASACAAPDPQTTPLTHSWDISIVHEYLHAVDPVPAHVPAAAVEPAVPAVAIDKLKAAKDPEAKPTGRQQRGGYNDNY